MRTLRLSLAGTVILVLLASLTGIVLAQDAEEVTWTHVTGQTNMDDEWVEVEPAGESRLDGSVEYMDEWSYIMPVEWSDPRLGESMHLREGTVLHQGDPGDWSDDLWVFARAVRLDGPEGAWAGSARGVVANDLSTTQLLYELTGEGGYEGLSAVFTQDNSAWPVARFDGWIFEGDLPTMPEPVEPSAEAAAVGEAVVWHRLSPDGPEHERLACSEMSGTPSCEYDKVKEAGFAWDAGSARFSGDEVTASWVCPAWFPAPVCDGVVSVWSGTTRYQPVEGEAAEVPQELVVADMDGQPQLWLHFTDWALACPWYGTFEEALAANPEGAIDCAAGE